MRLATVPVRGGRDTRNEYVVVAIANVGSRSPGEPRISEPFVRRFAFVEDKTPTIFP